MNQEVIYLTIHILHANNDNRLYVLNLRSKINKLELLE